MTLPAIDLGHGVSMRFVGQATSDEAAGILVEHRHDDGKFCQGFVTFDTEAHRELDPQHKRPTWTVVQLEPLTISPSVLRRDCGLHGWITEGRWVPA